MSQPTVIFDAVWKKFRQGERNDSLRDLIPSVARRVLGRRPPESDLQDREFWAVRDVSFEVRPGEALGIIGPNGAGKSTTLKLLTKILKPTTGASLVRGRVGALIEVAAGFHPDLTGRENVYLQGAIMGMRRADIVTRFDDIIDFAGVGAFIDTPVKRYSSGMNARLGFAIAVNLNPEVLIIDEVLSVGDMAFQRRCVDRMREFKNAGVSIVFVSHNLQAIGDLCDQALYLERNVRAYGPTAAVLEEYTRSRCDASTDQPTGAVSIRSARLLDSCEAPIDQAAPGADLTLRVEYSVNSTDHDLTFGLLLHRSTDGLIVYDANFTREDFDLRAVTQMRRAATDGSSNVIAIDYHLRANVTRGLYHFELHILDNVTQRFIHRVSPAAHLTVHEQRTWAGIADLAVRPAVCPQLEIATT
jgi:ABC-type polysaccharide/polyol phosphate transport system ATPase subunit